MWRNSWFGHILKPTYYCSCSFRSGSVETTGRPIHLQHRRLQKTHFCHFSLLGLFGRVFSITCSDPALTFAGPKQLCHSYKQRTPSYIKHDSCVYLIKPGARLCDVKLRREKSVSESERLQRLVCQWEDKDKEGLTPSLGR